MFKNYDPGLVVVVFGGIQMRGYADGTFVQIERAEDAFSMAVGAGGDVVRVRNRNRTGSITVTLQRASPVNDLLAAIALADEVGASAAAGVKPIMVRDLNGTLLAGGAEAWIRKLPTVELGVEHSNVEWVIDVATLQLTPGGAIA